MRDNEQARRAFEREASLLGNLRHAALPKVMDYFTEEASDYLVMEFIAGRAISNLSPEAPGDLQRIIRRCLAKDPEDRYQTIKDVAIELIERGANLREPPLT